LNLNVLRILNGRCDLYVKVVANFIFYLVEHEIDNKLQRLCFHTIKLT
jgi:hypothetical protein